MAIEKRKERRIKVALPIKIVYRNTEILGKTENLSRLGAYVEIDKEIPLGAGLDITLRIPAYSKEPLLVGDIKCKGSIFRSGLLKEENSKKYYGAGIFFTDFVDPFSRDKLSRYIDFLILKEKEGVKEGVEQWRKKRNKSKKSRRPVVVGAKQDKYKAEVIDLLKQALVRLDEIRGLLKSGKHPS